MANIGNMLKDEINRLCRRQVNAAVAPLRKELREQRKALSELKKQQPKTPASVAMEPDPSPKGESVGVASADGRQQPWVTSKGIRALRGKLCLTQQEFARLLGVSAIVVHKWEAQKGKLGMRRKNLAAVVAARGMGIREANSRIGKTAARKKTAKKKA